MLRSSPVGTDDQHCRYLNQRHDPPFPPQRLRMKSLPTWAICHGQYFAGPCMESCSRWNCTITFECFQCCHFGGLGGLLLPHTTNDGCRLESNNACPTRIRFLPTELTRHIFWAVRMLPLRFSRPCVLTNRSQKGARDGIAPSTSESWAVFRLARCSTTELSRHMNHHSNLYLWF